MCSEAGVAIIPQEEEDAMTRQRKAESTRKEENDYQQIQESTWDEAKQEHVTSRRD